MNRSICYPVESSVETSSIDLTRLGCILSAAAFASTAGLVGTNDWRQPLMRVRLERMSRYHTAPALVEQVTPESDTGHLGATVSEMSEIVRTFLGKQGLHVDQMSITADGSALLQFTEGDAVCVDIYPSGVTVVIVRKNGIRHIYETGATELEKIAKLLKNGEVAA